MIPDSSYLPILRAKQGELEALGHLSPRAQARTRPLLDIPTLSEKEKRPLSQVLCETTTKLGSTWGTKFPLYLDMSRYAPDIDISGGQHPVELLFEYARQCGLRAIPVTGPLIDRGPEPGYLNAVARIVRLQARGAAVRIRYAEIASSERLLQTLGGVLQLIRIEPSECDVILDLEALERLPSNVATEEHLLETLQAAIVALKTKSYRSLALCGSSIPATVGKQFDAKPCRVPRIELGVWRKLISKKSLPRILFGDYGIIYPFQSDGGAPVRPPSRIRLSTDKEHILYRSSPDGYRQLRATVAKGEAAERQAMSWGKKAIFGRGHGFTGSGNASVWVARDTNAHIETTLQIVERQLRESQKMPARRTREIESIPWLQEGLEIPEDGQRAPSQ